MFQVPVPSIHMQGPKLVIPVHTGVQAPKYIVVSHIFVPIYDLLEVKKFVQILNPTCMFQDLRYMTTSY